ncbi:hypothetical protein H9649_01480 [Sporosarcina sp. Sa2YVA2]|uniref:Uncharacterized protein n=1 Tax=Sporosarcina quadrami TaxID=2762234 RepID=A0ABR8U5C7_9BACL|nr:hypothetical protein [Sporosarcina quadrami]MBD7983237.1 hypothetical protein [Sporosarcina quadrami]
MNIMLRIIMLALFAGSAVSISAITLFNGFDIEGAMIGLASLVLLFGITTTFYLQYKKQISHV